ncbi:sensor histidine kinase [Clavibacter tessellarius]|uniref:sensor histidine kinase n=1 Tax=Clavibacter tessellarius TaxID=31965 RepID=UPI0039ED3D41
MTGIDGAGGRRSILRRATDGFPRWATDLAAAAVAALSYLPTLSYVEPWVVALFALALAALLVRRRTPRLAVLLTVPALYGGGACVPVMIALAGFGARETRRGRIVLVAGLLSAGYLVVLQAFDDMEWFANAILYTALFIPTPMLVGVLLRTRRVLRAQIDEMTRLRERDRRRAREIALAEERALLAREMHDVVSHQVTLIAVQAGGLQLTSDDERTRDTAKAIRRLASVTMDELRGMVQVLRSAGGGRREPSSQHGFPDLEELIRGCGLDVRSEAELPQHFSASAQRAVYRFVQEGLTNAGKHAPGSAVHITTSRDDRAWSISLVSGPARQPQLALPSGHFGLIGLRDRAALLGGTVAAGMRSDGTHELRMELPDAS